MKTLFGDEHIRSHNHSEYVVTIKKKERKQNKTAARTTGGDWKSEKLCCYVNCTYVNRTQSEKQFFFNNICYF